jgi:hypothetical protein
VGYDPKVSGPWSDVDLVPPAPASLIHRTDEEIAETQAYWDAQQRARERRSMDAWDRMHAVAKTRDPQAYALARGLRELQPPWAEDEECEVTVEMVREVLDKLRIRTEWLPT